MGLCCLWHAVEIYFRLISVWLGTIITTCVIWIPLSALLFYLFGVWIRFRAPKLLPQLRKPLKGGKRLVLVGFFHPYCNAGGGGERVLWVAIRALQNRYPNVRCVIYTGDTDASREEILCKARHRFNVQIPRAGPEDIEFVFLKRRQWVEATPYPFFTLLGQSLGSFVLGMEALWKFVPDVYLDTMGYAFTLPLFKYLGGCKIGCYVHYPTISTDMLEKVATRSEGFNNASFISRNPILSYAKLVYYKLFAYIYGVVGNRSDKIMVNSSWTFGHIIALWKAADRTTIVYPPCDTEEFLSLPLIQDRDRREHTVVSIGQFRPEKDHPLQIKSFCAFLDMLPDKNRSEYKLIIIGSCRNSEDRTRVDSLRELASSLGLEDQVEFKLNVSFDDLKENLSNATIGIHTMWNEHFGIGVVEMMAAGTITLAHNSGGPKLDIVTDYDGKPTGFMASDEKSYARAMKSIMDLKTEGRLAIRINARESVHRFSEAQFENGFLDCVASLVS